jgi:N-acetylmuramoyl-L-alanine amidase
MDIFSGYFVFRGEKIYRNGDDQGAVACVRCPAKETEMKRRMLSLGAAFILFMAAAANPAMALQGRVIMVDPGHGGYDPGAVRAGILEKNINLQIALKLKGMLEERGARVLLTRNGDYNLAVIGLHKREAHRYDLSKRLEMAKEASACLFVSIHANCVYSRGQQGAEVFYYPGPGEERSLAESIQEELASIPGMRKRAVKTSNCFILRNASMPAVLIEVGYLSNSEERKNLLKGEYQEMIAGKVCSGIIKYLDKGL